MFRFKNMVIAILALFVFVAAAQAQQTARIQIIHNAADPAVKMVDVYVNGEKFIDDFAFRAATPFVNVPAGVAIEVGLAPSTSMSADDVVKTFSAILNANETYVAVANGVLDPASYAANPDGKDINVTLFIKTAAREKAMTSGNVEFAVLHGATDAPTVDVVARNVGQLVNDAYYGAFTDYLSVPAVDYTLDVTDASGQAIVVSYAAPLSGLANGAAIVFASGFFNPAANQNGPAFGLFAALPDGNVIQLPVLTTARLQVIHNAADPAAEKVDIYANGSLLLNNFKFRQATPFIDVPANTTIAIGVAPATSTGADDVIATFNIMPKAGGTYVAIANGVLNPTAFSANPDGKSTAFNIFIKEMARETTRANDVIDAFVFHGATDAPAVDIVARDQGVAVDNASYGDMTGYLTLPISWTNLDVTLASDNSAVVASYQAGFWFYRGNAAVIFASGFLNPAANQNGAAFDVLAAFPNGQIRPLKKLTTARLQVIHNAADPAAEMVDVYVNGAMLLDDFGFRKATPFIDVPANTLLSIGVAPSTSSSASDVIASFDVSLIGGGTYIAIANGVLGNGFAANPDGKNISFTLFAKDKVREVARYQRYVQLLVFHGATDAPAVDVVVSGSGSPLIDNLTYGEFSQDISVLAGKYILDITPAGDNSSVLISFAADLSGLARGAAVVFASGFLTPAANNMGAAFGLFAALSDGNVIALPVVTNGSLATYSEIESGTSEVMPASFKVYQNYPNPFNPATTIAFSIPESDFITLKVYDIMGREVATLLNGPLNAGQHQVTFDAGNLASGKYFYRLQAGNRVDVKEMMLLK